VPGTYTISGIHAENFGQSGTSNQPKGTLDGKEIRLWSGTIATNTITVEVKP